MGSRLGETFLINSVEIERSLQLQDAGNWQSNRLIICRKGMDLYFKRHDGQAVTCDDFRAAMADANEADLSGLQAW